MYPLTLNDSSGPRRLQRGPASLSVALSASFPIEKSIRQGCPLSALLFSVCLSPFIERLYGRLQGIDICGHALAVRSYADDVTAFLSGWNELRVFQDTAKEFQSVSGLELNPQKTKAMVFEGGGRMAQ